MEADPDSPGSQRIQISSNPGQWYRVGEDLPGGGTLESTGEREIEYLPPKGGGDPFKIKMGDSYKDGSKPSMPSRADRLRAAMNAPVDHAAKANFLSTKLTQLKNLGTDERDVPFWWQAQQKGMTAEEAQKVNNQNQRDEIDAQIEDANFPDPRTDDAVRIAVEDMLAEQFVGLKLLKTSAEHEDGVPDNIYFEAGDGSVWEWNSNGEIHRAD
jgi:hypothetical protein